MHYYFFFHVLAILKSLWWLSQIFTCNVLVNVFGVRKSGKIIELLPRLALMDHLCLADNFNTSIQILFPNKLMEKAYLIWNSFFILAPPFLLIWTFNDLPLEITSNYSIFPLAFLGRKIKPLFKSDVKGNSFFFLQKIWTLEKLPANPIKLASL